MEESVATRTCGIAKRFTDMVTPRMGATLRAAYIGDAVIQVSNMTGAVR